MSKYRSGLFLALVMLLLAVFLGLGIVLGQLFKNYYIDTYNDRLQKETKFVSSYIQENDGVSSAVKSGKINSLKEMLDSNITVVNQDGSVQYSTDVTQENNKAAHSQTIDRIVKENSGVHAPNEGYSVYEGRYDQHYYWKKLKSDGEAAGFVILSNQIDTLKKANQKMWLILAFSLGTALVVLLVLAASITSRYTKPIEAATSAAIELAKGNYRVRTYEEHSSETGMLSNSINILARNLQEMENLREMQQDRLGTLVENMGSGVLLIDSRGYITLINKTYRNFFGVDPLYFLYRLYYEVVQHKEVILMIEQIFMTEQSLKKHLVLPVHLERKYFEVYGAPIIGSQDEWKGILLVFHDITELKKLEQVRKDFVANVSHELKTPITSIKGFTETLLDGALHDEKSLKHFLSIVLKESDRMQTLIQELLDLSKIEQQGFSLSIQNLNLTKLLQETLPIFEQRAALKQIKLSNNSSGDAIEIEGDYDRIKQILINLISNAISYTPPGGSVEVSLEEDKKYAKVSVKDTGIGMAQEELPRIFERFYRIDKARSRNFGGTGLGLAIVKHLVEAHQGNIQVKSEPGDGTEFTVLFNQKFKYKHSLD
ncbi:two-component system phosphate regulon sensor histidine kinase PhoR [Peribacillus deserti]|uniref:histidine kinase n=1 Tax=Peribacillus deserti TaxID=673318 RepID=A0ABS2QIQ6_9BACI|nr:ATP-binding protein [Peribacillus deserti]MBM7692860.1 two-component system phosphate regulon sensor histidine kinase PhoR [Peribacillus deserti]